jgi:hypothetical protein
VKTKMKRADRRKLKEQGVIPQHQLTAERKVKEAYFKGKVEPTPPNINPCDFCLVRDKGDCHGERKKPGEMECGYHWCNLPEDSGCSLEQVPECTGYDKCPNVKAFYDQRAAGGST